MIAILPTSPSRLVIVMMRGEVTTVIVNVEQWSPNTRLSGACLSAQSLDLWLETVTELLVWKGVSHEVTQELREARRRYADHTVCSAVVKMHGIAVVTQDPPARKDDVGHVTQLLIASLGTEDPLVSSCEHLRRIITIK
jgi:hypothetical protein